jgi:hypothetical protein
MDILESLLDELRCVCSGFSDGRRRTDVDYSMADIGLSAFSIFLCRVSLFCPISGGWSKGTAHRIAIPYSE